VNHPPRVLGLSSATCIVVGIFFTPAKVVALTGDATRAQACLLIISVIVAN